MEVNETITSVRVRPEEYTGFHGETIRDLKQLERLSFEGRQAKWFWEDFSKVLGGKENLIVPNFYLGKS